MSLNSCPADVFVGSTFHGPHPVSQNMFAVTQHYRPAHSILLRPVVAFTTILNRTLITLPTKDGRRPA